jgi:hypothetical protein
VKAEVRERSNSAAKRLNLQVGFNAQQTNMVRMNVANKNDLNSQQIKN